MAEETTPAVTLLLVAKDSAVIRLLPELFHKVTLPATLHVMERGEDALAFLRHAGAYAQAPLPDVMLLDLDLPEGNRLRLLEEIANDAALPAIPVVLFSGTDSSTDHLVAASLVAAYLTNSLERGRYLKLLEKLAQRMEGSLTVCDGDRRGFSD
jgi:CheY-like chemotaxis protein